MNHSRRLLLLLAVGLALSLTTQPASAKKKKKAQVENADDLLIVDCTLPGRVKRMGNLPPYVGKGRRIRTSAVDCRIRGGDYAEYDRTTYASSLSFWQPAADGGDPEAQSYLGEIYEKRQGPDYELAALWYRKAAKQDYARAQVNLAHLYEQGLGVAKDLDAAREWYGKAAGIPGDVVLDSIQQAQELKAELELLQQRFEASEHELEEARSELEGAEGELEELRRNLEKAQRSSAEAPPEEVTRLASALQQQETEVARRTEVVRTREQTQAALRKDLDRIRASERKTTAGPTIDILRPDILATRGSVIVPLSPGVAGMVIKGRASAPAGLRGMTVDDRTLALDSEGFFDVTFPRPDERREVTFVVSDQVGRNARRTLILLPSDTEIPPVPTSSRTRRAAREPTSGVASKGHRALIIGIADYSEFQDLETAERDAEELQAVLEDKYGFGTTLLRNPSRLKILHELNKLKDAMGPEQNLLIYYAGHGQIGPRQQRGYWIPADAKSDDTRTWILNEAVTEYLGLIKARHILVVSDSCYSGTLTRSGLARLAPDLPADRQQKSSRTIAEKRSRTALTSGGLQPVLDVGGGEYSLFAGAFLRVLKVNDAELSGDLLKAEVAKRMARSASQLGVDQVPRYAPIHHAGHEAGDFVLLPVKTR